MSRFDKYARLSRSVNRSEKPQAKVASGFLDALSKAYTNIKHDTMAAPGQFLGGLGAGLDPRNLPQDIGASLGGGIRGMGAGLQQGIGDVLSAPLAGVSRGIESGIGSALGGVGDTYGYRLNKYLNSGFSGLMNRVKGEDIAAQAFITSAASNMASRATDLLADIASKALSSIGDAIMNEPTRRAVLNALKAEDPVIANMSDQELLEAYHTIAKFAPTLAKDKNAVRSALRMAAQSQGGLSYHAIKGLAEAETAVNKN